MITKECAYCRKKFQAQRKTGTFCSRLCAHNSWVEKHDKQWAEYNRQWRQTHPDYWREYYNDGRGVEVQTRRHAKHPLERKARGKVSHALRIGQIIRPNRCQICGETGKVEAHHWHGYNPDCWLDIQWLCHTCHLEAEKEKV